MEITAASSVVVIVDKEIDQEPFVCTYYKITSKHLHCYINEYAGRHNVRHRDTADIMAAQARNMVGRRLIY